MLPGVLSLRLQLSQMRPTDPGRKKYSGMLLAVRVGLDIIVGPSFFPAMSIIEKIESEQIKKDVTDFKVGDTVKVHTRVVEGDKERIQVYSGIVIGRKGAGLNANFTVRRVSYGEGVERVFPLHSPRIAKIEIDRQGSVRRSKLNFLRDRKGKSATTVKEKSDRTA
jgi:large subunit ribosomal protein L19